MFYTIMKLNIFNTSMKDGRYDMDVTPVFICAFFGGLALFITYIT